MALAWGGGEEFSSTKYWKLLITLLASLLIILSNRSIDISFCCCFFLSFSLDLSLSRCRSFSWNLCCCLLPYVLNCVPSSWLLQPILLSAFHLVISLLKRGRGCRPVCFFCSRIWSLIFLLLLILLIFIRGRGWLVCLLSSLVVETFLNSFLDEFVECLSG